MKFELNDYHRDVPDEELISDVLRVLNTIGSSSLTIKQYEAHGKYGISTFRRHFGSWKNTLEKCGIETSPHQEAAMSNKNITNAFISNELLISDMKRVALLLNQDTLNSHQYREHGEYSDTTCARRFAGWDNALKAAGLLPNKNVPGKLIDTNDLLQEIERVWILLGRQPTSTDIKNGISKYSLQSYTRRFGGWRGALQAFVEWVDTDDATVTEQEKCEANPTVLDVKAEPKKADIRTRTTSRDINLRLRFRVMQRDNFKCCMCGASPAKDPSVELHIDHIVPWAKGGETTFDNLQTLCSKCNLGKSDLLLDENA